MPLKHSSSQKSFSDNVRELVRSGKAYKTAVAIAYDVKRKAARKK